MGKNKKLAAEESLPFIVEIQTKGNRGYTAWKAVPVDALSDSLKRATRGLAKTFASIREVGGFELSEVTIGLEVNGEGGVSFIGSAKAGGSAAIQLKFNPPAKKK